VVEVSDRASAASRSGRPSPPNAQQNTRSRDADPHDRGGTRAPPLACPAVRWHGSASQPCRPPPARSASSKNLCCWPLPRGFRWWGHSGH